MLFYFYFKARVYFGAPVPTSLFTYTLGTGPSSDYLLFNTEVPTDSYIYGFEFFAIQNMTIKIRVKIDDYLYLFIMLLQFIMFVF